MRTCGDCTKCCEGWLKASIHGIPIGNGKACPFLGKNCNIYTTRDTICKEYQCAWLMGLFPEWMQPNKSNVLVTIYDWEYGKYFRALELGKPMTDDVMLELFKFSKTYNMPYAIQYEGIWHKRGPIIFLQWLEQNINN